MGVKRLEALQLWFLRLLLRVSPGVPTASLLWETSLLSMELRVWREKLCLILHFRGLGEDAVARRVMTDQQLFGWPGLVRETAVICQKLGVDNPVTTDMSKHEYRNEVTRACHSLNEKQLRAKMSKDGIMMKKCELISQDEYGRKAYFEKTVPHLVRSYFSTRVGMLPLAGNYSHDRRFQKTGWWCRCGEAREEEEHVRESCPLYKDIREQYQDLSNDDDLVAFFQQMLDRRDSMDELEEEGRRSKENLRKMEEKLSRI